MVVTKSSDGRTEVKLFPQLESTAGPPCCLDCKFEVKKEDILVNKLRALFLKRQLH